MKSVYKMFAVAITAAMLFSCCGVTFAEELPETLEAAATAPEDAVSAEAELDYLSEAPPDVNVSGSFDAAEGNHKWRFSTEFKNDMKGGSSVAKDSYGNENVWQVGFRPVGTKAFDVCHKQVTGAAYIYYPLTDAEGKSIEVAQIWGAQYGMKNFLKPNTTNDAVVRWVSPINGVIEVDADSVKHNTTSRQTMAQIEVRNERTPNTYLLNRGAEHKRRSVSCRVNVSVGDAVDLVLRDANAGDGDTNTEVELVIREVTKAADMPQININNLTITGKDDPDLTVATKAAVSMELVNNGADFNGKALVTLFDGMKNVGSAALDAALLAGESLNFTTPDIDFRTAVEDLRAEVSLIDGFGAMTAVTDSAAYSKTHKSWEAGRDFFNGTKDALTFGDAYGNSDVWSIGESNVTLEGDAMKAYDFTPLTGTGLQTDATYDEIKFAGDTVWFENKGQSVVVRPESTTKGQAIQFTAPQDGTYRFDIDARLLWGGYALKVGGNAPKGGPYVSIGKNGEASGRSMIVRYSDASYFNSMSYAAVSPFTLELAAGDKVTAVTHLWPTIQDLAAPDVRIGFRASLAPEEVSYNPAQPTTFSSLSVDSYDPDTETVQASGVVTNAPGRLVPYVIVADKMVNFDNLAVADVIATGVANADASGAFAIEAAIRPGTEIGKSYSIVFGGGKPAGVPERSLEFFYTSTEKIVEAVTDVNAAQSADDMKTALRAPALNVTLDGEYLKAEDAIAAKFLQLRNENPSQFDLALGAAKVAANVSTYVTLAKSIELLNLADSASAKILMNTYQSVLGLAPDEDYTKYEQDASSLMVDMRNGLPNKRFESAADVRNARVPATALAAVNNADYISMTDVLTKYNGVFGLNLTGTYLKDTTWVNKAITKQNFRSVSALVNAFETRLTAYQPPADDPRPSGSGGGSGGKSNKPTSTLNVDMLGGGLIPPAKSPAPTTPKSKYFTDVTDDWAIDAVDTLAGKSIVTGVGQGKFDPGRSVKREELVKILVESLAIPYAEAETDFSDVPADAWFYRYVAAAKECGIAGGTAEGWFGAGEDVTREDAAVMIARAFDAKEAEGAASFDDAAEISGYAVAAVDALSAAGVIKGDANGNVNPKQKMTRQETAVMICRALELLK